MIWKPKIIPTYSTLTNTWTETKFTEHGEFLAYLNSQWKEPGKYNLSNTKYWRELAINFQNNKRFCDYEESSETAKEFWHFEKTKVGQGIIVDDFYVPGDYYWYLNFTPIIDKVKGTEDFAEVWDGDYHYYLYGLRARMMNLNEAVVKARQKGFSLKLVSKLMRNLWFIKLSVSKMVGYEEDFVNEKGSWKFAVGYRNFLNEHTPWYRDFEPDESLNWEQKKTIIEGSVVTKKKFTGLRSKLIAVTSKKNASKAVGGGITDLFCEEAGIAPNLDKVLQFAEAATKMGGIKTGHVIASGAVGELKDARPLEIIAFSPKDNGFLGVDDIFAEIPSGEQIAFFFPDFWNYITFDEISKKIIRCYDENGNSDIELAKKYLLLEEDKQKKQDNYILWKSQHPWNLQDAFAIREENIWPTRIIKEHQSFIRQTYEPLCIELIETEGKLDHKISSWKPVNTLKVDPTKDNRGVIEVDELPIDDPIWGLYYAGVDPIRQTNTTTSKSLMSVVIFKSAHMKDGKLVTDYPVARYTGRFRTWEETYLTCMNLIRFYNARVAVESNVTGFHEWAIQKNYSHYFMHRKEIHIINELMPNSTITNEIGVRMEGQFKEKALEFGVAYVDEVLSSYEKEGERIFIYGVSRLRDIMLMEEMLKFNPSLNTDRLIAFILGLMAARSNTNRNLIVTERSNIVTKPVNQVMPGHFDKYKTNQQRRVRIPSSLMRRNK